MAALPIPRNEVAGHQFFPLPLVPIEQFMLWDDTPQYPKRFRVILDVDGELDRHHLEVAIQTAARRHPLLLATLDASAKKLCWQLPLHPSIPFRWLEGMWDCSPFPDTWNLQEESGVRIFVSQSASSLFHISFDVHHAVSDGLGMRQFVADIILGYDHLCAGSHGTADLLALKPERLLHRGTFARPAPSGDSRPTTAWEKITQAYSFHFRGPAPLATTQKRSPVRGQAGVIGSPPSAKPDALSVEAHGHDESQELRHIYRRIVLNSEQKIAWEQSLCPSSAESSTDERVTTVSSAESEEGPTKKANLNDLILARFFEVLANWNREHHAAPDQQRLRVMIPTDLRTFHDGRLPAANRFGFGFVVSDIASCARRQVLVRQVQSQVDAIRRFSLGLDFLEIFGVLSRAPAVARRIVNIPRCMATGVLTNLGDLSRRHRRSLVDATEAIRIGNVRLECVTCFPPLRPKTFVGVGVCGTRDTLTLGLILDAHAFTESDAESILAKLASY